MNITSGIIPSAQKVVIYGPEGIGKSTFASMFPDPLFSDTEGSTKKLNVKRFDAPSSWQMLLQQAEYVKANKPCKTYVIDTADWAEKLCSQAVCARANKSGIEDFGYGKGYIYLKEEFGKLLNLLEEIVEQGIHIVFTAHSYLRKFEQPDEMGAYDRYEMKLTKYVAPMLKEWADTVLFANYKTYVVSDENRKKKAQGGSRMMFTTHNPCWDAKNRDGLPDELPFDFEQIKHIITFNNNTETAVSTPVKSAQQQLNEMIEQEDFTEVVEHNESTSNVSPNEDEKLVSSNPVIQQLYDLMNENKVSKTLLQCVVADNGYFPKDTPIESYGEDFISGCLIAAWPQVLAKIKDYKELPF
ncbi:MAG: ATP-binding protein [Eubacterium sp.]